MAVASPKGADAFRFRRLGKPEEFRTVEEIQRAAFGLGTEAPVPGSLQRAVQDHGGLVLGAFTDIYLAACAVGFLGWDGTTLYHYSHLLAVRPEYQNHQLGFRLKSFQRDEVLGQGLSEIRWTYDPLSSRLAHLYLRRLGAEVTGYLLHHFGRLATSRDEGLETDRVSVTWTLAAPRVEDRLAGRRPARGEDEARWTAATAIVETEPGDSGIRRPTAVAEPSSPTAHLEVPFDLDLVRTHEPGSLRTWRHAVRDAFRLSLDLGYRVDDFLVVTAEHERRGFYLLTRGAPGAAAPAAGPRVKEG